MTRATLALLAILTTLGCVSNAEPTELVVTGLHEWYLVGDELTPGDDQLVAEVTANGPVGPLVASVAGTSVALAPDGDGFRLEMPIAALPPGEHELTLSEEGSETVLAQLSFRRSHALYVMVSTDWDTSDPSAVSTDFQDGLHDRHPGALITHFVGPYTFTDPALSDARVAELTAWLIEQRDEHGDEVGLHIHPYCHFVEHAGVACNTDNSTVYEEDLTGYTINLSSYDEVQLGLLLDAADQLFSDHGLGKPVTFRAGGWTASIETLRALESHGYLADTSANNWARMEEWRGVYSGELYRWNMENWASIGDASQPYYPNQDDVLSSAEPRLSILEVPDNAIMVDYVSVGEMSDILDANWDGGALSQPVSFMMGFHPSVTLSTLEQQRVDGLLDLTDGHLASEHAGPIVYALLRDMPVAFPR